MVLDDASTPDSTFASPTAPSSDMDRYSGDQNPTILSTRSPSSWPINRPNGLPPLHLNFSNLPMPYSPFGKAASDAAAQRTMGDTIQKASDEYYKLMGRTISQTEGDALAYHLSKALSLASWGPPAGITAALFLSSRPKSFATFRFPGWTPGAKFNPDKFLFLKGWGARMAWHGLRGNCYFVLGLVAGQTLMGSYAFTVANVGRLQDPRLKDLNESLANKAKERRAEKGIPIDDRTEGRRGQESFEMARQRTRAQSAGNRGVVDDMSPTGGSFSQDYGESGSGSAGGNEGMLSDSQIQQLQQREERTQERTADGSSSSSAASSRNVSQQSSSSSSSSQPTTQASGGSAWDRLRQQAQTPQSQQTQQRPSQGRQSATTNNDDDDAFGFSSGGSGSIQNQSQQNDQQLKSDAQREFDAQLDRERQGKGFEEKGGNSRW